MAVQVVQMEHQECKSPDEPIVRHFCAHFFPDAEATGRSKHLACKVKLGWGHQSGGKGYR